MPKVETTSPLVSPTRTRTFNLKSRPTSHPAPKALIRNNEKENSKPVETNGGLQEANALGDTNARRGIAREANSEFTSEVAHYTSTIEFYKAENERLRRMTREWGQEVEELSAFVEIQRARIQKLEETLQDKREEIGDLEESVRRLDARVEKELKEKMAYWDELSKSLRTIEILESAVYGEDGGELGSHNQNYHLCDPIVV
jgi:predicted RNase H-like nuclease (RuvC/YqgF family)